MNGAIAPFFIIIIMEKLNEIYKNFQFKKLGFDDAYDIENDNDNYG